MKMKQRYFLNKESKVGDSLICPSCGTTFTKTNYQQAFCKSKPGTFCKDKYWNNVTETKRNNITRISPASAAYLEKNKNRIEYMDMNFEHPFSSEGLGQW
jgi:hypothetical protein